MPQRRTAIKDLRTNRTKHMQNLNIKTELRKTIKKFLTSVESKNKTEAQSLLPVLYKKLDKASKRKVLHDNTASRRKARFSKLVQNLS